MKPLIFLLTSLSASMVSGQSTYEKELAQLTAQRDKAIENATAPINQKYREMLEALLKKATQASDLDAALKIREALGQDGGGGAAKPAGNGDPFGNDMDPMLEGTKWLWPIEFAGNTPEAIRWITFGPNRVVKHGWYNLPASWRTVKPGVIELTQEGTVDFIWIVEFNDDYTRATVIRKKGRDREPLRLLEKDGVKAN